MFVEISVSHIMQVPVLKPTLCLRHSALRGCTVFSVLDITQAYHQVPIAKESQSYLTINTHIGLCAFKRLPNGIHSGPAIFQRIMDNLLSDIPKAVSRLDDILVAGTDEEDHFHTLSLVLMIYEINHISTAEMK